ncbi:MAG: DUF2459 domain-containing protein [Bacteroidota bacterium]
MIWIKRLFRILLWVISPIILYLLFAVVLSLWPHAGKGPTQEAGSTEIFFRSNGVHVDLFLPVKELSPRLREGLELDSTVQYVAFGWGDRQFYLETPTWDDLRVGTVVKSFLWPTESALHVTRYMRSPTYDRRYRVGPKQLEALEDHIIETLEWEGSQLLPIGEKGYGTNDRFYEAEPSYHAFYTCNLWLGSALKKARIPTSQWSPFVYGILHHLPTY